MYGMHLFVHYKDKLKEDDILLKFIVPNNCYDISINL